MPVRQGLTILCYHLFCVARPFRGEPLFSQRALQGSDHFITISSEKPEQNLTAPKDDERKGSSISYF